MEERKRPAWEVLILAIILVITVALVGFTYKSQIRFEKQKNLHHELQILRTAVMLYKSVNKENPAELTQLTEGTFTLPGETTARHYIEHPHKLSKAGQIDPFGNAYAYDAASGWVKSVTPGYEFW